MTDEVKEGVLEDGRDGVREGVGYRHAFASKDTLSKALKRS